MSTDSGSERLDPRKRRTRLALHLALEALLQQKDFDSITVQDVADAADLNRATFYAHFPDKFALLECMIERRFEELLFQRNVSVDENCSAALGALTLAVYEYLGMTRTAGGERQHQLEPHLEAAVILAVRRLMLHGLAHHGGSRTDVRPELLATTASWALFGAVKEWMHAKHPGTPDDLVAVIQTLVAPILEPPAQRVLHTAPQ